ncbi:MAG: general secretion pathway protein GspK [Verrucomicrobiales bacterium]|nr:general secretion pathway protein GspK [Verrucomicrobiales bacterium]
MTLPPPAFPRATGSPAGIPPAPTSPRAQRGSVLIIVLWVTFGLVSLALYFANSMSMELRASENRVAAVQADQAILGAAKYVTNLLADLEIPGRLPDSWSYRAEAVPIGEAQFWFIGRPETDTAQEEPVFSLADEGARLPLNSATAEMLQWLPRMTAELAAAIVDWRDEDSDAGDGGAEDETYQRLNQPYRCKNAPFESLEELRLVRGMTTEILYGEDTNLNGVLDSNENDGDQSPPVDNRDGHLDPGLIEYLTLWTRPPTVDDEGNALINVTTGDRQQLATLLQEKFGADRANALLRQLGTNTAQLASPLQFYLRAGFTPDEFAQIEGSVTAGAPATNATVNVNTASEAVLACIPGIGPDLAPNLVARRRSNASTAPPSLAWVTEVLDESQATQAGPFLSSRTTQFVADVAAVGRHGRGYRRVRFICDLSGAAPRLVARRDLTDFGWSLGREVRRSFLLAARNR